MDWQPIESAPRDGTEILTWCPQLYQGKGGCKILLWTRGEWHSLPFGRDWRPTHWMPVPNGPGVR